MSSRYKKSEQLLNRAETVIPLGSQTFSKSKKQFPKGASPFFADRAKGAYIWDVDGNRYADFMNALLAITLGYNDPDVLSAVKAQLKKGTVFSLVTELEYQVAEKICEMVPCAEMVRFGKNGSDATAGAIRLARAYTGKDHVLVCGYHGWQDWYIGATSRNLGVPITVQELTHSFEYNHAGSLERLLTQYRGRVAAVILEPVNVAPPANGFLEAVKDLTHTHEALLVFDEIITGFRFGQGGAQEYFGVTPDLATFGKGLANGYPLSAVAGRREIMQLMEDVFFSFTFGGEALSLAASLATLLKIQHEPVLESIHVTGLLLQDTLCEKIRSHDLQDIYGVGGYPAWSFLTINDADFASVWELKTLLLQEMFAHGVIMIGSHNISYAHTETHVRRLMRAYDKYFKKVKTARRSGSIRHLIAGDLLVPLFEDGRFGRTGARSKQSQ